MTEMSETTGWVRMWTIACTLGFALKCATLRGVRLGPRVAGWFLAWPGMDAKRFLNPAAAGRSADREETLGALFLSATGALFVWRLARPFFPAHPLVAGWIGMIGVVLLLHFGVFHLLSIAWRRAGVAAEPIMLSPLRAATLMEFWGQRWNTGFSNPARRFVLRPLARRMGAEWAAFVVFVVSGLVHELVITVPARGGYGLPTAYFVLQGIAAFAQKRLGLERGPLARASTLLIVAVPALALFPPVFVRNVILPMLEALGAIGGPK